MLELSAPEGSQGSQLEQLVLEEEGEACSRQESGSQCRHRSFGRDLFADYMQDGFTLLLAELFA